jgi:trigger factor
MKCELKDKNGLTKTLTVIVSSQKLSELKSKVVDGISKRADLPGFRKGKAPKDVLEKKHAELVKNELLRDAVPQFYQEAIKETGVSPVSYPKFSNVTLKGDELHFTAEFEVKPELSLDASVYADLGLTSEAVTVTEEEIAASIGQLKKQLATAQGKEESSVSDADLAFWSGYVSVEELKNSVKAENFLNRVLERRRNAERRISEALMEKVPVLLPESVVNEQKQRLVYQQRHNLMQRGIAKEDIQKHYDDIEKGAGKVAEEQLKLFYIFEAIAKNEKIAYTQNNLMDLVMGMLLTKALKK